MKKTLKKLLFKNELEELQKLKKSIDNAITVIDGMQIKDKIKDIALNLAVKEIAQRTNDKDELVKERIIDNAIENFDYVYGADNPNELQNTIDDLEDVI